MFYPVYIHPGDETHAYGAVIPDFPGCFSAADEFKDLPANIQEAVELHFEGEDMEIPSPSSPEKWVEDECLTGGYWLMVDIDLSKINNHTKRLNICLPEKLIKEIDTFAQSKNMSRSAFLAVAARNEIAQRR